MNLAQDAHDCFYENVGFRLTAFDADLVHKHDVQVREAIREYQAELPYMECYLDLARSQYEPDGCPYECMPGMVGRRQGPRARCKSAWLLLWWVLPAPK